MAKKTAAAEPRARKIFDRATYDGAKVRVVNNRNMIMCLGVNEKAHPGGGWTVALERRLRGWQVEVCVTVYDDPNGEPIPFARGLAATDEIIQLWSHLEDVAFAQEEAERGRLEERTWLAFGDGK